MLTALGASVVWLALSRGSGVALWPDAGIAALAVVGAAGLGKLVGLAAADLWLWATGRRLERALRGAEH